jgi:putative membrane protein
MMASSDPRVLFAAERTLLAWQRSSIALMGFGFVIERFGLFLSALRGVPDYAGHHLVSLLVGVVLIIVGACVAFVAGVSYRRFVGTLPLDAIPSGYWVRFGFLINLAVAGLGLLLATCLLMGAF